MASSQLQTTMAELRLILAGIQNKERQLDAMIAQFRTQLRRLPRQFLYGSTSLDASVSAMGEIEERLDDAIAMRRRVLEFKRAALEDLQALELIKQVEEARQSLKVIRQRAGLSGQGGRAEGAEILAEIRRLESFIADYSKQAEQSITSRYEERRQQE